MSLIELYRNIRRDGFVSTVTGLGNALRDKSESVYFVQSCTLSDTELESLFNDNDLAETIVSAIVDDALKHGIEIESEDEGNEDDCKSMQRRCNALDLVGVLANAATMGRLFGGAAIMPVVDDATDPSEPFDEARMRALYSFLVLDKRQLSPRSWYADATSGKLGQVETYSLTMDDGKTTSLVVHESRLVLFPGARTTRMRKRQLNGWDRSELQAPYDVLKKTGAGFDSVMQLMADLSQAVWKVRGLIQMISGGLEDVVKQRMEVVELARSAFRAVILDSEGESFERVATPLNGVDAMIDRMWQRLAAAARMPMTRLFGMSPAGLNATGQSDQDGWYDEVQTYRLLNLQPRADRLVRIVALSLGLDPEMFHAYFPSLYQMTPKEQADLEKMIADKDVAYVAAGVLLPEEVTLARWGSGKFSAGMTIDVELRQALLKKETQEALNPKPEPVAPPAPAIAPPAPRVDHVDAIAKLTAALADARRGGIEIDISAQLAEHGAPVTGKVE